MGPGGPRNYENPLLVKFKMVDDAQIFNILNGCNSATDC